jgi:serpin B
VLSELTRVVLANALFIWAAWAAKFDSADTEDKVFHTPDGDVEVPMMKKECWAYRRATAYGLDVAELPYKGGDLAALVIVPGRGRMEQAQRKLDATVFGKLLDQLFETPLIVEMPRFELRDRRRLTGTLQDMGVTRLFGLAAELDDIYPEMAIDEVVHEALLEVNEDGTKAAAATAATDWMSHDTGQDPTPERFVVDRPFLFYLYDRRTRAILLASRVLDPTAG